MDAGTYTLSFVVRVQAENRIAIPAPIAEILNVKPGDYIEAKIRRRFKS